MPRIQGRIDPDGAIVRVQIRILESVELDMRSQGLVPPGPLLTTGLIDTGASQTAFHPMIVQFLGLKSRGFATVATPGHPTSRLAVYDARLGFDHSQSFRPLFEVEAVMAAPATTSVLVLIDLDVLDHCTLYFDGQNQAFSLWF